MPYIPTRADDAQHARYVGNIIRAWHEASPADLAEGRAWYTVAHGLAGIIGHGDTRMGAGVLAALSQSIAWDHTVKLAHSASNGDCRGHLTAVLGKVRAMLAGTDPADLLPADLKTGHFYRNILGPDDPDPVTIDRHAHDVAVRQVCGSGDRGLSNVTRYATLAHAYREAARRLGARPCVVQAVTWCYWRRVMIGK